MAKAKRKEKESTPKTNTHGVKTVRIMSRHTEVRVDKKELEKKCQQLQKEREEMWESLGMNWRENSCLPIAKERVSYSFITELTKKTL